ncbi:serine/threonine protein kinase [Saprolegnia diclina VS20]|uniref:Serine/threonine protein kinase n=1 Tax=Saprolegnia diclina (strain VS20) TaxID=1156394 RepID=T0Q8Y8_SAPDV|nr:serine/threonine protein kinase [Saprolegnia diclina VS20]EQC29925.1 serine/threonine protein kinase [Saprolegnia diclina VS20]|eukprot:XP_008616764.1 serine/threonine protein kinase [Saprolegnia diclina VS20]
MALPAYAWALWALLAVVTLLVLGYIVRRKVRGASRARQLRAGVQGAIEKTLYTTVASPRQPSQVPLISSNELEVVGTLGGGMYSVVAKAVYQGRDVALKTFNYISQLDDFGRQAQTLYQLRSPYLVSLVAVADVASATPQLVFEFMDGGNLDRYIYRVRRPHSPEAIALAVARGLQGLHHYDVVHRDVRLRNILVATDGRIKLADFGFARENAPLKELPKRQEMRASMPLAYGPCALTRPPRNYWVAPEALTSGDAGTPTDIYQLGTVMIELMWQDKHGSMDEFAVSIMNVQAGTATADLFGEADWYHELALRCVAHTPSMRPTAAEIVYTIEQHLHDIV